jgi:Glucosamine-6-phosphate isomerases/6-phosphogluconolactonase
MRRYGVSYVMRPYRQSNYQGSFALTIPGGSILKIMIADENELILFKSSEASAANNDWTTKRIVAYVNHKCVPMDNTKCATHTKAYVVIFYRWTGVNVLTLDGTSDGTGKAMSYTTKLHQAIDAGKLQTDSDGYPVFDLTLVRVGDNGNIGSFVPQHGQSKQRRSMGRARINERSTGDIVVTTGHGTITEGRHRGLWCFGQVPRWEEGCHVPIDRFTG